MTQKNTHDSHDGPKNFSIHHHHKGRNSFGFPFVEDTEIFSCRLPMALEWLDTYQVNSEQSQTSYYYGTYKGEKVSRKELIEVINSEIHTFDERFIPEIKRRIEGR